MVKTAHTRFAGALRPAVDQVRPTGAISAEPCHSTSRGYHDALTVHTSVRSTLGAALDYGAARGGRFSSIILRNWARPRDSRDHTVPMGPQGSSSIRDLASLEIEETRAEAPCNGGPSCSTCA